MGILYSCFYKTEWNILPASQVGFEIADCRHSLPITGCWATVAIPTEDPEPVLCLS